MTKLNTQSIPLNDYYNNIETNRFSMTAINKVTYDFIEGLMGGEVTLVDPSNPMVQLLELSSIQTVCAINDNLINLRKTYPALSVTEDDIYTHLTDLEYVDRFGTAGECIFTVSVSYDDLEHYLVFDSGENCYKGIIPKDTYFTVDNYTFSLEYAIVIRKFDTGWVSINYDTSTTSPLSYPETLTIPYQARIDASNIKWIFFDIKVKQLKIESFSAVITSTTLFNQTFNYDDQFILARVYTKSTLTNNQWEELATTHSEQVYDLLTPTVVLKATTNKLNVSIPYVYISNNLISGKLRVDIYSSKGNINVNFSNYSPNSYVYKLRTIDDDLAQSIATYTNVWANINFYIYSTHSISGGVNGIDFTTLRDRVINYTTGTTTYPIRYDELKIELSKGGYDLELYNDSVTHREYKAIRQLNDPDILIPSLADPSNNKLLTTATTGNIRFSTNIKDLKLSDNAINNVDRVTLLSGSLFQISNGVVRLLERSEVDAIKLLTIDALLTHVNTQQFAYNPYHYVFESINDYLNVRPYNLDQPTATNLSLIKTNESLILPVNTGSYSIVKNQNGYVLTIVTKSEEFYKGLNDSQVGVQLVLPTTTGSNAYINGILFGKNDEGERIYDFFLDSNFDVDSSHTLCLTSAKFSNTSIEHPYVQLSSTLSIIYTTTSITTGFIPDETDLLIQKDMLPVGSVGNTHDQINVTLGYYLKHLWARTNVRVSGYQYVTSLVDVPLVYDHDVYLTNPATGSIAQVDETGQVTFVKLYEKGTVVVDPITQEPEYLYKVGDPILDSEGNPIQYGVLESQHELDLFVIDGKLEFVNDQTYLEYKEVIKETITGWITEELPAYDDNLLEKTSIYWHPINSLGEIEITTSDNLPAYITAEQSPIVEIYVDKSIGEDGEVKAKIDNTVISIISKYFLLNQFTLSEIESEIKNTHANNIYGVYIKNIGGEQNLRAITIKSDENRLCIKKKLSVQQDGIIITKEDVSIQYFNYR